MQQQPSAVPVSRSSGLAAPATAHGGEAPSDWVLRWLPRVRAGGRVLDLACGQGRHASLAAGLGLQVTALDRDAMALQRLQGVAGIATLQADIEAGPWPFAGTGVIAEFDAVIVTNYLHRALYAQIAAALAPDGLLIYETFMLGNALFGRPSNPDFLLRPDELLTAFPGLSTVAFEQGEVSLPRPAMLQRLCARRAGDARGAGAILDTSAQPLG